MRFSRGYLAWTGLVLATELFIALEMDDAFVRPYVGDTLAVVLLYAALRSVLELSGVAATLIALAIAYGVELAQYFHAVDRLGLSDVAFARVVLGTYCDPRDFLAYTAAVPLIALAERVAKARRGYV
jgi:hypothetical protein